MKKRSWQQSMLVNVAGGGAASLQKMGWRDADSRHPTVDLKEVSFGDYHREETRTYRSSQSTPSLPLSESPKARDEMSALQPGPMMAGFRPNFTL